MKSHVIRPAIAAFPLLIPPKNSHPLPFRYAPLIPLSIEHSGVSLDARCPRIYTAFRAKPSLSLLHLESRCGNTGTGTLQSIRQLRSRGEYLMQITRCHCLWNFMPFVLDEMRGRRWGTRNAACWITSLDGVIRARSESLACGCF